MTEAEWLPVSTRRRCCSIVEKDHQRCPRASSEVAALLLCRAVRSHRPRSVACSTLWNASSDHHERLLATLVGPRWARDFAEGAGSVKLPTWHCPSTSFIGLRRTYAAPQGLGVKGWEEALTCLKLEDDGFVRLSNAQGQRPGRLT